jgi:tRNA dimethylallyltransferase
MPIAASPLLVVLGPTGAGKGELAILLAEAFGGEIVNCDSIQVYRGLEIGASKIPLAARHGIPHHLISTIGPREELTAGAYARLARHVIGDITQRGRIPIVAGGTGFYLRALLAGLAPAPERNEDLRKRLSRIAARRPASLHYLLRKYDPEAARRIHPHDLQKLIRALEMMRLAGRPASATQSQPRQALQGYTVLKFGLAPERSLLYIRLNERAERMFREGLLEETHALLVSGIPTDAKPLRALGYKQAVRVLRGQMPLADAIRECQIKTRQYAKRQFTWFRTEPEVRWLPGFGTECEIRRHSLREAESFLAKFRNRPDSAS